MNYSIKSRRLKAGIPLDLPVNYRRVWYVRLPNIIQMMQCGIKYIEIAKHYKCEIGLFSSVMHYHGIRAIDIRRQHKIDNRSLTERRRAAEDRAEAKRLVDEDAA
jgi:hypothetical protein